MNEENEMSKLVVYGLDGDPELPCIGSCPNNTDMGPYIVNLVGAGNPFYAFESLPVAILGADTIGANFNSAPLASADYQTNRNTVAAQYLAPVPTGETNDSVNMVWKVA